MHAGGEKIMLQKTLLNIFFLYINYGIFKRNKILVLHIQNQPYKSKKENKKLVTYFSYQYFEI